MATNPYFTSNFSGYNAEQELVHSLTIESHQIFGTDLKYMPRTLVAFDSFYGEDSHSSFDDAIVLEMYIKSYGGFDGYHLLSKFGLEITEELVLTCSRRRFADTVTASDETIKRPREGDLIYIPYAVDERMRVFEISYVNQNEVMSQLGERYTWEIRCRVFGFNGEKFNTGDTEIDEFDMNYLTTEIKLTSGSGAFIMGDIVTQANGFRGEVVSYNTTDNTLTLTNTKGPLDTTLVITNGTITRDIVSIEETVGNDSNINDNKFIKQEETVLVDFSEKNPFSGF